MTGKSSRNMYFSDQVYLGIILRTEGTRAFSPRQVRTVKRDGQSWHYPLPNPDAEAVEREVARMKVEGYAVVFFRGTGEELKKVLRS